MKIRRIFTEKKPGFDTEAKRLQSDLANFLGQKFPALLNLKNLRLLNRYDISGIKEANFTEIITNVFFENGTDNIYYTDNAPVENNDFHIAVEFLPGQYNQREDAVRQCIELHACKNVIVKHAWVYVFSNAGSLLSKEATDAIKKYLINPVDSREADSCMPKTLVETALPPPATPVVRGLIADTGNEQADTTALEKISDAYNLAMSLDDLKFCRAYFKSINRDPTLAELRILDTYWSDHCRHTTFNTILEKIDFTQGSLKNDLENAYSIYKEARKEAYNTDEKAVKHPQSLMDMAVIGAKVLKKRGFVTDIDESPEVNACTVKITADFSDGTSEPWLFYFKNETHNHPTEIEPFGGAATCLGGGIRDPLSGRAIVHQAMRITGAWDPRSAYEDTLPGKLPQRKIARDASMGYSSYGNQIGVPGGQVAEIYHPGFLAKRMELGALAGAAPAANVRREEPKAGDLVLLIGGKTGRDGIGAATGSSKIQTEKSVEKSGAEVQKGNAIEELKILRLFRRPEISRLIKRCNDFGAGGVAVAVGELAAGLEINLDKVPAKYRGMNGTELAISESQERMAVVIGAKDLKKFIKACEGEDLDAAVIAKVTADSNSPNAFMRIKWQGKTIAELSRKFLNSNGASRSASALVPADLDLGKNCDKNSVSKTDAGQSAAEQLMSALKQELASLRSCSRSGLGEHFDSTIGAGTVLFPMGGKTQGTPECGMAALLPSGEKECVTASIMTFGYDPYVMEINPYIGAKGSVREALVKFACMGGNPWKARLSFQEYFGKTDTPQAWGKPAAALLGALEAQLNLGVPAIGGKDSMSGNYRDPKNNIDITVPPSLLAFAAGICPAEKIRTGTLSGKEGNAIILFSQNNSLKNEWEVFKANINALMELSKVTQIFSAYPVPAGGTAAALALMAFGNETGLETYSSALSEKTGTEYQGTFLAEINSDEFLNNPKVTEILAQAGNWKKAAVTISEPVFRIIDEKTNVKEETPLRLLRELWEQPLAGIYPVTRVQGFEGSGFVVSNLSVGATSYDFGQYTPEPLNPIPLKNHKPCPTVLIPIFPGTNCELDLEKAFIKAGTRVQKLVFKTRSADDVKKSLDALAKAIIKSQILVLTGGYNTGDEPEGSGKYITNVLHNVKIRKAVLSFLKKNQGLILGIGSGFQALLNTGLLPYGTFREAGSLMPKLSFNRIGRHISRMARTKVMSRISPWLALEKDGEIHVIPVSHGEGRLSIQEELAKELFEKGQIPFCYVDEQGQPSLNEPDNPGSSDFAIEAMTSPDGRILGKMGRGERCGKYIHINIPGNKEQKIFEAGVKHFK